MYRLIITNVLSKEIKISDIEDGNVITIVSYVVLPQDGVATIDCDYTFDEKTLSLFFSYDSDDFEEKEKEFLENERHKLEKIREDYQFFEAKADRLHSILKERDLTDEEKEDYDGAVGVCRIRKLEIKKLENLVKSYTIVYTNTEKTNRFPLQLNNDIFFEEIGMAFILLKPEIIKGIVEKTVVESSKTKFVSSEESKEIKTDNVNGIDSDDDMPGLDDPYISIYDRLDTFAKESDDDSDEESDEESDESDDDVPDLVPS